MRVPILLPTILPLRRMANIQPVNPMPLPPYLFYTVPVQTATGAMRQHGRLWRLAVPAGTSVPDANTIVVIGDATHNHTVVINQNGKVCGSLTIYANSVLDLKNFTGHNFGALPDKGVTGTGTMRIASNSYFPRGDFGDFIGENGGTVEYYTLYWGQYYHASNFGCYRFGLKPLL